MGTGYGHGSLILAPSCSVTSPWQGVTPEDHPAAAAFPDALKGGFSTGVNPANVARLKLRKADFRAGGEPTEAQWAAFAPSLREVDLERAKGALSSRICCMPPAQVRARRCVGGSCRFADDTRRNAVFLFVEQPVWCKA